MNLDSHPYPFVYFRGKATTFTRSNRFEFSYFGGPGDFFIDGPDYGPSHVHHILTLWNTHTGIQGYDFGVTVPFFYGMCFEGCDLEYRRSAHAAIEITKIDPMESTEGSPYPGYPPLLPYIPLTVEESIEMPLEQFSESVMQGIDSLADDILVAVVPPNPLIGVSMWGPSGDHETVQVIFLYDTKKGTTVAYNACT